MYSVSKCIVFQNVKCLKLYNVAKFVMFKHVKCSKFIIF